MEPKKPLRPLSQAYRLLNPGPVVLLTAGDGQRDNVMALTWNTPVRKEPPMAAVVLGKRHHTYPLIERTGELAINVPEAGLVDAVMGCGSASGRDLPDKLGHFGLTRQPASKIKAPLVAEAVANLECRVCQVVDLGASALLLLQVVEALVDPRHYRAGSWAFDNGLRLIHHLGGRRFLVGERVVKAE